jgi:2-phospho-L-lactate guanylyltransferase
MTVAKRRIIVPMKPLDESKSRLRDALPDDRRRRLSLAMLTHVIEAATALPAAEVTVFGGDEAVRQACEAAGCAFSHDGGPDLNGCLRSAFYRVLSEHQDPDSPATAIFLPADLPLLTTADVAALADCASDASPVAIAPDRHNAGTNGLAVHGRPLMEPAMGPGSFVRHLSSLSMSPAGYIILRRPGLGFDVDTPADLELLLKDRPDWWESAAAIVDGRRLDPAAT